MSMHPFTLLAARMPRDSSFSSLPFPFRNLQVIPNPYAHNAKNVVNRFNIAFNLGCDFVTRSRNFTHLQCACKGAEQSTTNRTNHVIESGRNLLVRFDTVEFFDSTMNTESDRMLKSFKMHFSDRALDSINSHPTGMHNL